MYKYIFILINLLTLPAYSNTYTMNEKMKSDLTYNRASAKDILWLAYDLTVDLTIGLPFTILRVGNSDILTGSLDRTKVKTKSVKLGASIQLLDVEKWRVEFTEVAGNWENPQPISNDTLLLALETERKKRCSIKGLFLAKPAGNSRYELLSLGQAYYYATGYHGTTPRIGTYNNLRNNYEYDYLTSDVVGELELVDQGMKIHFDQSFILKGGMGACALKIKPSELSFSR